MSKTETRLYKLVLKVTFQHFYVLFYTNESVSQAYTQKEGITYSMDTRKQRLFGTILEALCPRAFQILLDET